MNNMIEILISSLLSLGSTKNVVLVLISVSLLIDFSSATTQSDITTCESQSSFIYGYGQCINCSQNCALCNGTVDSNNLCVVPSIASCQRPGFMYNGSNACQDCRIQANCILNCNGYWNPILGTCIQQANVSFQVLGGLNCLDTKNQAQCQLCADQHYGWSTTLSKCLKCPSGSTWNSSTMTCSQLSTCDFSNLQGLDTKSGTCLVCNQNNSLLSPYSISCEPCPSGCSCSGSYASCSPSTCVSPYTETMDTSHSGAFCECKGAAAYSSDGSSCVSCSANCLKCDTNGNCLQCGNGMLIDITTNLCVQCAVSNPNPLYCDIKVFAYCSQLTTDGQYCNQCIQDLVYDSVRKYCICTGGRMFNVQLNKCVNCSDVFPNCAQCDSYQCIACMNSSFTLTSNNQSCTCSGFIQNNVCSPCSQNILNCATCDSTGQTCLTCNPNYGLASNACYACNSLFTSCVTCNSSKACTGCSNGYTLSLSNNSCVCDQSTNTRVVLNNVCYLCQNAIPNCIACGLNSASNAIACQSCSPPYIVSSSGTCQLCSAGYYRSGTSCVACKISNCGQCNATACYSCINGYTLDSSGNCSCTATGYIIDSVDSKCKTCASKFNSNLCQTCSSTACTSCSGTGFTANASGCQCVSGVILPNSTTCQACSTNCTTCTLNADNTTTTCSACSTQYRLLSNNSCSQCTSGTYYNSSSLSCNNCNTNCAACPDNQGGGSCTACLNNYVVNSTTGNCQCSGTMVLNSSSQCVTCASQFSNPQCSTCSSTACLTCSTNYYLQGSSNQCIQCSSTQYFQAGTVNNCVSCPSNCSTCTALTGVCTGTCLNNYDLVNGTCQCANTKTLTSSNTCVLCSSIISNCSTCSSATTCTACATGFYLMSNGICGTCPSSQYYQQSSQSCQACPVNCSACANITGTCSGTCLNNYKLDSGSSLCVCSGDRALNSSQVCSMCNTLFQNCQQCTSTGCTLCNAPFTVSSSGQCVACTSSQVYISSSSSCANCNTFIRNCNSCSSPTTCLQCADSTFTLASGGSACNCSAGNYVVLGNPAQNTNDQCLPCSSFDSKCLQCSGFNVCTLCVTGNAFDSSLKKCRSCSSSEYYNNQPANNIQSCTNCNTLHQYCTSCSSGTACTTCSNNYDPAQGSCTCTGKKILVPSAANSSITVCKLCTDVVDPNCSQCSVSNKCDQCNQGYRWDSNYLRCIPDIALSLTSSTSGSNRALADNYTLTFTIPEQFIKSQLNLTIYYYDNVDQYLSEAQNLKSQSIADLDIPFYLTNCYIFAQDNLSQWPNKNYTSTKISSLTYYQRKNYFLLHEGTVRFIYTVRSLNNAFARYAVIQDLTLVRAYQTAKDIAFNIGSQVATLDQFSLYNVFTQILIQQNEICTSDSQCNGNGTCKQSDKICVCQGGFTLFDCSDYVTIGYDTVIEEISNVLQTLTPLNYPQKIVDLYLPILQTQSTTLNQTDITSSFQTIQNLISNGAITNNQRDDISNIMKTIMNSISSGIIDWDSSLTPLQVQQSIQQLQITADSLLSPFNNQALFITSKMQLQVQGGYGLSSIVPTVNTQNLFQTSASLSQQSLISSSETTGTQVKVQQFAYLENPHKLTSSPFMTQAVTYPLIIMNTFKGTSRLLTSSSPTTGNFVQYSQNFTFTFAINNAKSLRNPLCLSLNDTSTQNYVICEKMEINDSQVICTCLNSATVYEDIYYNFLPNPATQVKESEYIPVQLIVVIVILSILVSCLFGVQVKNIMRSKRLQKAQLILANKQESEIQKQYSDQQNAENQQINRPDFRKQSEMTMNTQFENQLLQSPVINPKSIRLTLFENSPGQNKQCYEGVKNYELVKEITGKQFDEENTQRVSEEEQDAKLSAKLDNDTESYQDPETPITPFANQMRHIESHEKPQ